MKTLFVLVIAAVLSGTAVVRAQDAATEERLNKLAAQIQDLADARDAQNRKLEELTRAVEALQQQLSKPNENYASQETVKLLAKQIEEVDRKRQDDDKAILEGVEKELKALASTWKKAAAAATASAGDTATRASDKYFERVIQPGDTLSGIVAAYREQNIKVTVDQILKENPGLDPRSMPVGKKIYIPAP